ncbi:MAG: SDR family NAD(P)-dependent oxidoreductase [Crocinitomicaceae bacterium]|nr:SDR family NAD(P)-dependent oxidoreductase [Crocinitomicaceae bacterium]
MLENRVIFFTGATSGFGLIAALEFVHLGATVVIAARSKEKFDLLEHERQLKYPTAKGNLDFVSCDLSSLKSVAEACEEFKKRYAQLDILINNAGIWNFSYRESQDKIEEIFQVNLIAPVLINQSLHDLLAKSDFAKSIFTSSGLHQGNFNFSDPEFRNSFSGFKAYRQSKLGIILITRLYDSVDKDSGISYYSQHPGMVNTKLGRDAGWFSKMIFKLMGKSPEKGAQTLIYLVTQPKKNLTSGAYYYKQMITQSSKESYNLATAKKVELLVNNYFLKVFPV